MNAVKAEARCDDKLENDAVFGIESKVSISLTLGSVVKKKIFLLSEIVVGEIRDAFELASPASDDIRATLIRELELVDLLMINLE